MSEPIFATGKREMRQCENCQQIVEHHQMQGMYFGHQWWTPGDYWAHPDIKCHRAPCGESCDNFDHKDCCRGGAELPKRPTFEEITRAAQEKWARGEPTFTNWGDHDLIRMNNRPEDHDPGDEDRK